MRLGVLSIQGRIMQSGGTTRSVLTLLRKGRLKAVERILMERRLKEGSS
jgi:hypothetical protein